MNPEDLDALRVAHTRALAPRVHHLADDHDPHLLHPGRTALILLLDLEETDAVLLAAALLTETQRGALRASDGDVLAGLDGHAREVVEAALSLRATVPDPLADDIVEKLVTAGEDTRRVALAERLDHARHAHVWREGNGDRMLLGQVEGVYGPVALRTHPMLAKRFESWRLATVRRLG